VSKTELFQADFAPFRASEPAHAPEMRAPYPCNREVPERKSACRPTFCASAALSCFWSRRDFGVSTDTETAPQSTLSAAAGVLDLVDGILANSGVGVATPNSGTLFSGNFEAPVVRIAR
jgi:hypothetical protein